MSDHGNLAILGGTPVVAERLIPPAWPPRDEATADKLKELYLSGAWSFNCPAEQAFARDFAAYHTAAHGIFMVNGTVTLECALIALGIGAGDEVIVPGLTWMATAMAVHYVGATPVFVDVAPDTLCLDHTKIKAAITPKTKAIIAVHLFNSMADMDEIMAIANDHDLKVIEDCAHMQGGKWDGRGAGSIGHIGSFSFQQSKTMAAGEGGICITSDPQLAERLYRIKHIGYPDGSVQGKAGTAPPQGLVCHNYRATGFQAIILHEQLKQLQDRMDRYNRNLQFFIKEMQGAPGFRVQKIGRKATQQGVYAVVVMGDQGEIAKVSRELVVQAIAAEGLGVGSSYGVVYRHLLYNMPPSQYRIAGGSCPVAEGLGSSRCFSLVHQWLDAPQETLATIARIFHKVGANAAQLLEAQPAAV